MRVWSLYAVRKAVGSVANEQNLLKGKATRFTSGEVAVNAQKKSAEARKRNTAERKLIKERILERMQAADWDEVIDGVIARAKESDKGFEVLRDTVGEKPVEGIAVSGSINNPFADLTTEELKKLIE